MACGVYCENESVASRETVKLPVVLKWGEVWKGYSAITEHSPMHMNKTSLILAGGAPMTSQIARRVIESFRRKAKTRDESVRLSVREEQILLLLSQGCRGIPTN